MDKKLLFILIISLIFLEVKGQKCKVELDPFSSQETVSFNYDYQTVFFQKKEDKIFFEISFNYWGERLEEFEEKTEILIKLKDGKKFSLKSTRKSPPKLEEVNSSTNIYGGFGSGTVISNAKKYTVYTFAFTLTKLELEMFAESMIDVIRIPDTEERKFIDITTKDKRSRKKIKAVTKGANCIIRYF